VTESIVPPSPASSPAADVLASRSGRLARLVVTHLLERISDATVVITDDHGERRYGAGTPEVNVQIHDPRVYSALLRGGSSGLGETYVEGWWDCDDLTTLVRVLVRNMSWISGHLDRWARTTAPLLAPLRALSGVDKKKDRENIRAHYDIGNDFFELMLDETMSYSCAFFDDPSVSLADASRAKIDRICRKLDLGPKDHLVEIGTGWGGLAIHAASKYGCRVTTTTISDAQFDYATRRVANAGLADRVVVLNQDYRDLTGVYDKLVSVEMIEAVGWRQLDTFFSTCASLLRPDGVMGLQAIVIDDRSYERTKRSSDFIKDQIFPGGFLPSLEAMINSTSKHTDLRVLDVEDIGRHYAETLSRWRENLRVHAEAVALLNLGERFHRLWSLYLSYCEGAFLERHISDVQMIFARDRWRGSLGAMTTRA
jgi:cyclopropane-fatty-acyl-phospholipid synthase